MWNKSGTEVHISTLYIHASLPIPIYVDWDIFSCVLWDTLVRWNFFSFSCLFRCNIPLYDCSHFHSLLFLWYYGTWSTKKWKLNLSQHHHLFVLGCYGEYLGVSCFFGYSLGRLEKRMITCVRFEFIAKVSFNL